jgi:hypothetical protein
MHLKWLSTRTILTSLYLHNKENKNRSFRAFNLVTNIILQLFDYVKRMDIQSISRKVLKLKAKDRKDGPHQDGLLKWLLYWRRRKIWIEKQMNMCGMTKISEDFSSTNKIMVMTKIWRKLWRAKTPLNFLPHSLLTVDNRNWRMVLLLMRKQRGKMWVQIWVLHADTGPDMKVVLFCSLYEGPCSLKTISTKCHQWQG